MKSIFLLPLFCFISILGVAQRDPSIEVLHFKDSALSSYQYYQIDSIGKKFTYVQKGFEFRGGNEAWKKYLVRTVNTEVTSKYIKIKRGEKSAAQQVTLAFVVDVSGTATDIIVMNRDEVHPKLAAESIRIIQESPKWLPGEQEIFVDEDLETIEQRVKEKLVSKVGLKKVKTYKRQPMVFGVERG